MMELDQLRNRRGRRLDVAGRDAAVLIPILGQASDPHLLFTKRGDDLNEHAGQMSFPGGRREPEDTNRFQTATREAREEIGLRPDDVAPIGELDDIRTTSGYVVSPYVSHVPHRTFQPDGTEVVEVAILPVSSFLVPDNYDRSRRSTPAGDERVVHSFSIEGYRIWGATGRLVVQLLELTTNWDPNAVQGD